MKNVPQQTHPEGEVKIPQRSVLTQELEVETFAGKVQVHWDPDASVTPLGQLAFFIEFLKLGHRFEPWVDDCPLTYKSRNAPLKINVLGSLFLSILSGHNRYAHMTALRGDSVNTKLLGMSKVISDDSAMRALKRMDETQAVVWAQEHLYSCYAPLLKTPWIMDIDVTVKALYGHQEGAVKGYNPHKPGRPCHTYHTYIMANTRLVLEVNVQAGNQGASSYSMPGLLDFLRRLPPDQRPEFVRGDCAWGCELNMKELESEEVRYLFKLKRSKGVRQLIAKLHSQGEWVLFDSDWELKESVLKLQGWTQERRVIVSRRRLNTDRQGVIGAHSESDPQLELSLLEAPEDLRLYEYSVHVTNLECELRAILQHYRDRADAENNFDEIKNQWGWGGFVTRELKTSQIMSRMIALIYNWWTMYVRLAIPHKHHEAITSRPLLLTGVGRLTESGRQRKMVVTSSHAQQNVVIGAYQKISRFFAQIKANAPQFNPQQLWDIILKNAFRAFGIADPPIALESS